MGMAVNRTYADRETGEKKDEVCFVDLEAFGRTAETMNEYLAKGRPVLIEGRQDDDGTDAQAGTRRRLRRALQRTIYHSRKG